jgi:amidase
LTDQMVEATVADMTAAMAAGHVTSEKLVWLYLERIATLDKQGPRLNTVLEVNPDAVFIARAMDRERDARGPRGPLHGVPVLLKDNIDTHDKMHTSAGSLALASSVAPKDAFLVERLRQAGAVILGKANMTEFANFMAKDMPSGYSSRGGQVLNPYLPGNMTPSGSSSGPAAAVAASLTALAVGTETSGSILSPASHCSVVGIKPTLGAISRSGIIPIAMSQDTAGPLARTVTDAALLLGAMTGADPADPATWASEGRALADYTPFLDPGGLKGARIGVPRRGVYFEVYDGEQDLFEAALDMLRSLGAEVVDPADFDWCETGYWRSRVLEAEFKAALNAYLAALGPEAPVRSLQEILAFNQANPEACLKYGQYWLEHSETYSGTLTEPGYLQDRQRDIRLSTVEGIDAVMKRHRLDALVYLADGGDWVAARAGYPSISIPAGYTPAGRPMNIMFTGTAWSEPTLVKFGYAYEQATRLRVAPLLGE